MTVTGIVFHKLNAYVNVILPSFKRWRCDMLYKHHIRYGFNDLKLIVDIPKSGDVIIFYLEKKMSCRMK